MIKFLMIILLFIALTVYEFPQLKRKNEKKEWIVFLLLMLMGLTLSILFVFHVSLYKPM